MSEHVSMTFDAIERVPSREEVADNGPDGLFAIKHFYGKTLAEAEEVFAQAAHDCVELNYIEDLIFMNPIGFRFYIRAAIRFALSERAAGEYDLINGLAGTLSFWYEEYPGELTQCARLLADFCSAVFEHFDRYGADPEIYTGLRERYQQLAQDFTRMADESGHA